MAVGIFLPVSANRISSPQEKYNSIIGNAQILEAFTANDEAQIKAVAQKFHLEYEKVENGAIVGASKADLPKPQVFMTQSKDAFSMNLEDLSAHLANLLPNEIFYNEETYIVFPLPVHGQGDIFYLVFAYENP